MFLKLGCTSFGGPVAHLGYFRAEFVERRRWLDEQAYADLVSLCQFLPGPASSQVGLGLGLMRAGLPGALMAWLGFTLPSALALAWLGILLRTHASWGGEWLHGLKVVAVAVVAQALWGMGKSLCPDNRRATMAVGAALVMAFFPGPWMQLLVIAVAAGLGMLWTTPGKDLAPAPFPSRLGPWQGVGILTILALALLALPLLAHILQIPSWEQFASFFQVGSLVFGGGHVVLPLLQELTVPTGWVSRDEFIAGYGAAQAVPGPLFTFAAYLGAASRVGASGWCGAALTTTAIFLPSFFYVAGALPLWSRLRGVPWVRTCMNGVNAGVVGLLLAAFYDPVWVSAIHGPRDFAMACAAFLALSHWKLPPWLVVLVSAVVYGADLV